MRLILQDITVTRGTHTVLTDISITIESGEVVGLLGVNGSGKSTLLGALAGTLRPSRGQVLVGEQDVRRLSARERARRIAILSQSGSDEFDMTVWHSVMLGRHPHLTGLRGESAGDVAAVTEAMEQADVTHLADRGWTTLSGGERQRALFARTLAQQTPVLALDEPTNHLDISHRLDLLARVRASGRTTMVALHDLDLASTWCDRVAVLHRGRVVALGIPSVVLQPDLVRTVFGVESELVRPTRSDVPHLVLIRRSPSSSTPEVPAP